MFKNAVRHILTRAQIDVDGPGPDIEVHNDGLYRRLVLGGALAFGESYADGWWDSEDLPEVASRLLRANLLEHPLVRLAMAPLAMKARLLNMQSVRRAFQVGQRHYDLGNDLYELMLDRDWMVYSCALWDEDTETLEQAQTNKLDRVCQKLGLKPGDRLLDIGCGWGGLARFAAERYGSEVVGLTVSREQAGLASRRCQGLPVEIRLQDYRDNDEQFDYVASLGMIEHVGWRNYRTFMEVVGRSLKPGGRFFLQTIGGNETSRNAEPFTEKYIFPNGMLPSIAQLGRAIEGLFIHEFWDNFGSHYEKTLAAWHRNFASGRESMAARYGERFCRIWEYYLLTYQGMFRARAAQLWQIGLLRR